MNVIVNFGMGNVGSIVNMGRRAGCDFVASDDPAVVARANKLVLPGVGAFDTGMANLQQRGLDQALHEAVLRRGTPILGICLGAQFFTRKSEEGHLPGLGWLAADTIRFRFDGDNAQLKVPHMGWNYIEPAKDDPLLVALPAEPRYYFVHSYHFACDESNDVLTWTKYGYRFASAIRRGNIWGTQFHPEKSHKFGLALLQNFLALA